MKIFFKSVIRKIDHYIGKRYFSPLPAELIKPFYVFHNAGNSFEKFPVALLDNEIRPYMTDFNRDHFEHEYLIHYTKECIIEPQFGWTIVNGSNIILESIPYAAILKELPYPSIIRKKLFRKKLIRKDCVISLQYRWDNYFHFFNDILGQLLLLDKSGVPYETPVVIPERVCKIKYVAEAMERSAWLRNRNWLVLGEFDYVLTQQVYFAKNFANVGDHFATTIDKFEVKAPPKDRNKKIFVKRARNRARTLQNFEEIELIATASGFEIVDCDGMSLDEQIQLFSESAFICGLHGAGLTNMIFRKGLTCSVFEIFTKSWIAPNYYWLALEFGYHYDAIYGEAEQSDRSFYLDPHKFKSKLGHFMLQAAGS